MKSRRFGSRYWMVMVAVLVLQRLLAVAETNHVISTVGPTNLAGGAASYAPSFSGNGRFVVFLSHANNLVTNDDSTLLLDLFVHDLTTSNTTLVSVSHSGRGGGDADSAYASVSSNGQFVAFASAAGNLVPGDTNGASDVFVRDLEANVTSLISVSLDGGSALAPATNKNLPRSGNPLISADGRFVVFESWATNLVSVPDTNISTDIFIRDRLLGQTRLISLNATANAAGNAQSELPSITPDARRVAFLSYATDLVSGVTNAQGDIYVRDLESGTTVWASTNVANDLPTYRCHAPAISDNGQIVAFKASLSNAAAGAVFCFDLTAGTTSLLGTNSPTAMVPSVSADGRFVAYEEGTNVFVWDRLAGTNVLVDVRFNGANAGNGPSRAPVLSADGHSVGFLSAATDLIADAAAETNEIYQVFVRDLQAGVTRLLTADTNGLPTSLSHPFAQIAVSSDGSKVAFESRSGDLVAADLNRENAVFVRDLTANETRLISRRAESLPSLTGARRVRIAPDCLSADGRYLLFASLRNDLPPDEGICCENLFIRDVTTGAEEQITAFDELRPKEQVLSATGTTVAYISQTLDLTSSSIENIVFYDRQTGSRVFAHGSPNGSGLLSGRFSNLAFSPDGTKLVYLNQPSGDFSRSIYLFDSASGSNRVVTRPWWPSFSPLVGSHSPARFSPDGRLLVFGSSSTELTTNRQAGYFVYDITANTLRMIPAPSGSIFVSGVGTAPVSFSADSRFVATPYFVQDLQASTNIVVTTNPVVRTSILSSNGTSVACLKGTGAIFVKNLQTGINKVATTNSTTFSFSRPPFYFILPSLTPDGRYVIYASRASNLSPADTNQLSDIYARDMVRGVTILLSANRDGTTSGNGSSTIPVLSADGRTVVFQSFADDLAPGDYNFARDIFIVRLHDVESDGDAMDDDWEMAHFNTLSRDGTGDFDGDGASDLTEFNAGTDPTNLGSVFRVITITSLVGAQRSVLWSAVPGRTYQVQSKETVDDPNWTNLLAPVTATSTTATLSFPVGTAATRFLRVVLLPLNP